MERSEKVGLFCAWHRREMEKNSMWRHRSLGGGLCSRGICGAPRRCRWKEVERWRSGGG